MPPEAGNRGAGEGRARPGEVYFEFQQVGNAVKVAAVDAATGMEVIVMGPRSAPQADLQRLALALKRRLGKPDDA